MLWKKIIEDSDRRARNIQKIEARCAGARNVRTANLLKKTCVIQPKETQPEEPVVRDIQTMGRPNIFSENLVETWYKNGSLNSLCSYKDGKENGLFANWYEDGQLRCRCTYKDGKKHGIYESWYSTSKRHIRCNYTDGELHGLYEEWPDPFWGVNNSIDYNTDDENQSIWFIEKTTAIVILITAVITVLFIYL